MDSAWGVVGIVRERLKARNYDHAATLAKFLRITRAEAELALWYLREIGVAGRTNSGRWFYRRVA